MLTSCGEAEPGEQEEEEVVVPEAGEPQYGGTLTILDVLSDTAGNPDFPTPWPGLIWGEPVLEHPIMGDVEKYGPRGTGEFDFSISQVMPLEFCRGGLAESWEVSSDKVVFHVRPGVYFTGLSINPGVMERREYTAYDMEFNFGRRWESSRAGGIARALGTIEDWYAEDKYTFVVETSAFHAEWWFALGPDWHTEQYPPEVIAVGSTWENLVGTGPFYVKEHTLGVSVVYGRNPDYWRTTTINGKEYEIPFIDELVRPTIGDVATAIAAIRTGKVDIHHRVPSMYWDSLVATCPELLWASSTSGETAGVVFNCKEEPLSNRDVRRALMVGIDIKSIGDSVFPGGLDYEFPVYSSLAGHVPLDELPESTRLLFDYNPELARQMLDDAGYPDGFELNLAFQSGSVSLNAMAEMMASMWGDLGVKVKILSENYATYTRRMSDGMWDCSFEGWGSGGTPFTMFNDQYINTPGAWFETGWTDAEAMEFAEREVTAETTVDDVERGEMLEWLFVHALDSAVDIPITMPVDRVFWWPWVKNYWGEVNQNVIRSPVELAWVDEALKKEMGY